jgi:CheY-like chemotaxis protein
MQRDEMIESESSQTKQHILIGDDDAFMRTTFHDALVEAGFMATVVQDGAAAIAVVRMHRIDMVLLDLLMPGPIKITPSRRMTGSEARPDHAAVDPQCRSVRGGRKRTAHIGDEARHLFGQGKAAKKR